MDSGIAITNVTNFENSIRSESRSCCNAWCWIFVRSHSHVVTYTVQYLRVFNRTCITSILRLRMLSDFGFAIDPSWDNTDTSLWSMIECSVAVICASLPALRPLLSRLSPRLFGTMSSQRNDKGSSSNNSRSRTKFSFGRILASKSAASEAGSSNNNNSEKKVAEEVRMYNVVPKIKDMGEGKTRAGEEQNTSREWFARDDAESLGTCKVGIMIQQDFDVQSQTGEKMENRWVGPFISR